MPKIDPADCVWRKSKLTYNRDINGAVIDSHITYVCTTDGHMRHPKTVPGDALGEPVMPV